MDPPARSVGRIGLTRPRRAAALLAAACGLVMAAGTAPALADSPLGAVAAVGRLRAHVGVARGVVATVDGGRRWRLELYTSHRVHEVQFPTAKIGFALSRRGVLATTDGGAHWAHRGLRTTLAEVDFIGPRTGWGLAQTARGLKVVRTRDGGRTWKGRGELAHSVCFTTGAVGWIGKGRKVLFTDDGGATWQLQFTLAHTANEAVVHCTRGGSVWALFTDGAATSHQAYAVYASFDSGAHWLPELAQFIHTSVKVPRIDDYPGPFDVVSAQVEKFVGLCVACGRGRPSLTATTTHGRVWVHRRMSAPRGVGDYSVMFVDRLRGWVAEASRTTTRIVHTGDAGITWTRQYLG
ncbi:MAG TPA: hypothetical protein VJN72_15665 [Gaiellales bacterium]|nr:hypothetical protein [Gaiellales bacterium]